tara:strand:+ start:17102 stop:17263 length:162 start_codon:yes stop_codon:yes gene_type:complete
MITVEILDGSLLGYYRAETVVEWGVCPRPYASYGKTAKEAKEGCNALIRRKSH